MAARKASVSMKDVAALAGVSLGTVSNVMNSPHLVSEQLRVRVETAVTKLGWVPNETARQLRAGRGRSIGVVVMDIANPFFTDVIVGAEHEVHARGYTTQVGNSGIDPDRENSQLDQFTQQRVRGVLLAPIWGPDAKVWELRARGVSVVIVDRAGQQHDFCSVSVDDLEGGRLAVAHLIGQGHRLIAVVGGPGRLQQVQDRRRGADIAAGQSAEEVQLLIVSTDQLDVEAGVRAAEQIVAMPTRERPTAVFAVNDLLAIGLLQGFVTAGFSVPADVAIVGYDDIAFAAAAAVPLSSVRQPRQQIGSVAAELLFNEIDAADGGHPHTHEQRIFKPELIVRRSSAQTVRQPAGAELLRSRASA